jgi:hypothetical protein
MYYYDVPCGTQYSSNAKRCQAVGIVAVPSEIGGKQTERKKVTCIPVLLQDITGKGHDTHVLVEGDVLIADGKVW